MTTKTYCQPHPKGGEAFLPVTIPVSVMDVEYSDDDKYREFLSQHEIYMIKRRNFSDDESITSIETDDFGAPVEDINSEEDADEEAKEKEEEDRNSPAKVNWSRWHESINRAMLILRKKGYAVAKVQDGTTVYVMIRRINREDCGLTAAVNAEGKKSGTMSNITRIWEAERIDPCIRVNLLLAMLPYENEDITNDDFPCDGYEVFVASMGAKKAKVSFARVWMDHDYNLCCTHKAYYRGGEWMDKLSEGDRERQEKKCSYTLAGPFLVKTNGTATYADDAPYIYRHDRGKIAVRSVSPSELPHQQTKHYILDQAISLFNSTYGSFTTIQRKQWPAKKHWTEVESKQNAGINGLNVITEQTMETVNAVRRKLTKLGHIAISQIENDEFSWVDFTKARDNIAKCLHTARYDVSGFPKSRASAITIYADQIQHDEDGLVTYTIEDLIFAGEDRKERYAQLQDGKYILESDLREKHAKVYVRISTTPDIPLPLSVKMTAFIEDAFSEPKPTTLNLKYKSGFSLPKIQIDDVRSDIFEQEIRMLPSKKKKVYRETPQLCVQHFVIPDKRKKDSSENETICQRIFYELVIKAAVIVGEYPDRGNIESAMCIHYVPSKADWKTHTRTMPHYRYFLFDGKDIKELTKEEAEMSDFDVTMYNPDTDRHDIYAVKTKDSTYYIEKTDIIPYGSPEVDAEGAAVKPPLRGRTDMTDNLPGYFGISFFETLEAARSFYTDGAFYYCVADARYYSEISLTSGIVRSPHLYKVSYVGEKPRYEDLYDMLSDPIVRSGRYTVKPSIFKYIAEYMRCGGQK